MKRIIFVSIGLVLLMGCGKKHGPGGVLSGAIQYKGQPVNGAMLRLIPASGGKEKEINDISIPVSQEGTFQRDNIPPGEYKIVVEAPKIPPQATKMPKGSKDMDPAKKEEMQRKFQQAYGKATPTIDYPKKYKSPNTTDLKCTINEGDQKLDLELKD